MLDKQKLDIFLAFLFSIVLQHTIFSHLEKRLKQTNLQDDLKHYFTKSWA